MCAFLFVECDSIVFSFSLSMSPFLFFVAIYNSNTLSHSQAFDAMRKVVFASLVLVVLLFLKEMKWFNFSIWVAIRGLDLRNFPTKTTHTVETYSVTLGSGVLANRRSRRLYICYLVLSHTHSHTRIVWTDCTSMYMGASIVYAGLVTSIPILGHVLAYTHSRSLAWFYYTPSNNKFYRCGVSTHSYPAAGKKPPRKLFSHTHTHTHSLSFIG